MSATFIPTTLSFRSLALVAVVAGAALAPSTPARAALFQVSGTLSGAYPASALATFFTSGSTLTLTLENTSTVPTRYPSQVLTSFYFDLQQNGGGRPNFTYVSGSGNVYRILGGGTAAQPYRYTPPTTSGSAFTGPLTSPQPSNIKSSNPDDDTWYYRTALDTLLPPNCYYGIGTVGNSGFSPNGFPAPYVDGIDFGIFTGNLTDPKGALAVQTPNLYLVKYSAVFTFQADRSLDNLQFSDPFVFGFGTGPDQSVTITPEPSMVTVLAGTTAVAGGFVRRRRRTFGRRAA